MEPQIKIAVIGGTGKAGKYLVKQLLEKGYAIKLLLRNPESFDNHDPLIEVVKGDALDPAAMNTLLDGCRAVMSTLGQRKDEAAVFTSASRNVLAAMEHFGISRYILVTGLSIDTPFDKKSPHVQALSDYMWQMFPTVITDRQSEYWLLSESNVNWTLLRLPLIEQTDESREIKVSLEDCPADKISATDLALFLIGQLEDSTYVRKAPFIGNV